MIRLSMSEIFWTRKELEEYGVSLKNFTVGKVHLIWIQFLYCLPEVFNIIPHKSLACGHQFTV